MIIRPKYIIIFLVLICIVIFFRNFRYGLISTYCEYFCASDKYDIYDGKFIVRQESYSVPNFIKHIVSLAFPEYQIIYDPKSTHPNLIIKDGYNSRVGILDELKIKVPYLVYYPEKHKVKFSRYRASGYPLYQFTSVITSHNNSSYIPFVAYSKDNYDFLYESKIQNKIYRADIVYVFRHCVAIRDNFIKKAMATNMKIDSYGKCLNNKPEGVSGSYNDLKDLYSNYKFVVAMEHEKRAGYVTEKIVNAFEAGSIPIYWGDGSLKEIFNQDSFIDIENFESDEAAIDYINNIANNLDEIAKMQKAPKLTENGKKLFQINLPNLTPDAKILLMPIAEKIRKNYNAYYK